MALAETPDPGLSAHMHAVEIKAWVRAQLGALAHELEVEDPAMLG